MRAGRIIMAIIGGLLTTIGVAILVAGVAIVGIHATQRDPAGFYQTPAARFQTLTPALVAYGSLEGTDRGGWPEHPLGTIRVTARPDTAAPLFVGIAPAADVDRWLAGATYARVTGLGTSGQQLVSGDRSIGSPTAESFWVATAVGAGDQTLTWASRPGDWAIVVMNADASTVVTADVSVGSDTNLLLPLGILAGVLGLGVIGAGAVFLALAVGRPAEELPAPAGRPGAYPVRLTGRLEPGLSRWQWLVKWFLAIPHYVILALLGLAALPLTFFAGLAILVTGRYPRAIFAFNVGVMRWTWRVSFYTFSALATDRYPPFTLERDPTYPADLEVDYPQRLSRGLVLVKWWLLALPHYVIVALLLGSVTWGDYSWSLGWTGGIIALLVLAAAIVLLLTGGYPTVLFDLVMGLNRWCYRVFAYVGLLRDEYPPFRLDTGGNDPGSLPVEEPPPPPIGGGELVGASAGAGHVH